MNISREELDVIVESVRKLTSDTESKKISWTAANPTTFYWLRPEPPRAYVTLQKVSQEIFVQSSNHIPVRYGEFYSFKIANGPNITPIFDVLSHWDQGLHTELKLLYSAIEKVAADARVDAVKKIFS